MKSFFKEIRWIIGQTRGFAGWLIFIILAGAMLSLCSVSMAVASKKLIDAAAGGNAEKAIHYAVAFIGLIVLQLMFQAISTTASARTLEAFSNSLRQRLFTKVMQAEWMSFSKYHSGDILTRMTSDVNTVAGVVVNTLPSMISLGVRLIAAFFTLLFFEPVLAILAFILGPISVLLSRLWAKKLKKMHIKIQEAESSYRSYIHESIQNMLIVKTFCLEEANSQRVKELQNKRLDWILRRSRVSVVSSSVMSFSYWAGYFSAFGWGAMRLSQGAASFGTFTAFLQLVGQVQGPFAGLAYSMPQMIAAVASAGRLKELEELKLEVRSETTIPWTSAGIVIEDLSFAYEKDKPLFKDINISIKRGEITVLIGASGEGKTTLIRLLLALIHPGNGHIFVTDDQGKGREVSASTRQMISYVPQGNTLFSGTIEENLRAGFPEASEKEMEAAAKAACAWDFIEKLPDKFNTIIGERGLGLSEGQAQRIAIARALLRKTPILILDEATSALDTNTEYRVLYEIRKLNPARTCIIITHRPSAFRICDHIIRLEDGRVCEQHKEAIEAQASEAI